MIRSLAKAVPPNGSLTFFGDVAQQIYGHRMSWRSAGLNSVAVLFRDRQDEKLIKRSLPTASIRLHREMTLKF